MTASPLRRRRSTLIATVIAVVAVVAAAGLAVAGGLTLYNSTESSDTPEAKPELQFPQTPTGLLAVVDGEGELASMVVLVGSPTESGGSIVTVPVSADSSGGNGTERRPFDETLRLGGATALETEVEIGLGLTIDTFELVDEARLAQLLAPVGPIEVDLPRSVLDATDRTIARAGQQTLEPAVAAAVLAARDPDARPTDRYPTTNAIWAGIAAKAGAVESPAGAPGVMEEVLGPVLAGAVSHRPLSLVEVDPDENPREVDVVLLERNELILVFGQIAPGKMAAPNPALTFRIESPFGEADLSAGSSRARLADEAISLILFATGNVLSVSTAEGEVPAVTQVIVADRSLLTEVEGIEGLLGAVEISVAEERIAGVDATVRLGTSFIDHVNSAAAAPTTTATETTADEDD